jgi:GAF domain-containing protein
MQELGGVWPSEVAVFPIVAEGRVVAFLYCDNFSTGTSTTETEGLEIFISHAGLALEKSLLQRRIQEMEMKKGQEDAG